MPDIAFSVSPNAALEVRTVGQAQTPVVVIDEFGADLEGVIEFACESAQYGPDTTSKYPGLRAPLPKSYTREVLKQVYRLLFAVYAIPADLGMKAVNAAYSLITTPERVLEPEQCIPHYDTNRPYHLAILHYLNDGSFCDTGLFRHRATGLEKITADCRDDYVQSCREQFAERGLPEKAYITGSNEQYELYHRIEYRPNRLAVYPGCLLHSGLVQPDVDIDPNPRTGRLTANIFVDFFPLNDRDPA